MQVSRGSAAALLATAALAGSAATAITALGDRGGGNGHGKTLLRTTVAPSVPGDPALHGSAPGGAPWVLDQGEARLRRGGRLDVRLAGLVIPTAPANGTPGPVATVSASLFCGADTTPADTTVTVPISRAGDARISDRLTLPSKCLGPVVLVHPNGNTAVYIAATGFGG
jgi:hypothetical protein